MLYETISNGLRVFTYLDTYLAGLEYLAIYYISVLLFGFILLRETALAQSVGMFGIVFVRPIFAAAAMVVFVFTMFPIIIGGKEEAAWGFIWSFANSNPYEFARLTGIVILASIGVAFVPIVGRMVSFTSFVVGGVTLVFAMKTVDSISFGSSFGGIVYIPDFWFSVGIVVFSAVISWLALMLLAIIFSPLMMVSESLGVIVVAPIASVFGFVPLFIYGAWLSEQIIR